VAGRSGAGGSARPGSSALTAQRGEV